MKVALFCLATKLRFGCAVNARISASTAICNELSRRQSRPVSAPKYFVSVYTISCHLS